MSTHTPTPETQIGRFNSLFKSLSFNYARVSNLRRGPTFTPTSVTAAETATDNGFGDLTLPGGDLAADSSPR